jgi:succinate dehydrogenase / fumarate reductase flavoprotein subunit
MRIYPAGHYTMGGLWVDYNLMTTIPGLYSVGESNFSEHGANRLGAASLMQCSGDGYFILPYTIADYLADEIRTPKIPTETPEFEEAENVSREKIEKLMNIQGKQTATSFHRRLGKILWDHCGMVRSADGLEKAIIMIDELEDEFWNDLKIPETAGEYNQELEKAVRVADFFEVGRLMCQDALERNESCGAHFRSEFQTEQGEAKRNDKEFAYVSAYEYNGNKKKETLHKEPLVFENVELKERSYK